MSLKKVVLGFSTGLILTGCMSAGEHREAVSTGPSTFSLGKVQTSVKKGMGQDQVVSSLGSPNIVTTDEHGHEIWVYDKISTEGAYSASSGGGGIGAIGGGLIGSALLGGIGGVDGNRRAGAYENTQKTLTVTIKFDRQKHVQDMNYHQSKF